MKPERKREKRILLCFRIREGRRESENNEKNKAYKGFIYRWG